MSKHFKAGQTVRAVRDTRTLGTRVILKGETFKALGGRAVVPTGGVWPARNGHEESGGARTPARMSDFEVVEGVKVGERVEPETERVAVYTRDDFKVGDTVVENDRTSAAVVVERAKPVEPPKPTYGFGTAYVFKHTTQDAGRYRGFLATNGNFYFLGKSGAKFTAWADTFEDFHLED